MERQRARAGTEAQCETAPTGRSLQALAHERSPLAAVQLDLPIIADHKAS
jgi:hypothetical protein